MPGSKLRQYLASHSPFKALGDGLDSLVFYVSSNLTRGREANVVLLKEPSRDTIRATCGELAEMSEAQMWEAPGAAALDHQILARSMPQTESRP